MMTDAKPLRATDVALFLMLACIAWTGGSTDAICYGGLGHVFAANMTGHTVLLALSISGAAGLSIGRSFASLAAFLAGVAIGTLFTKAVVNGRKKSGFTLAIMAEILILIAFTAGWLVWQARGDWRIYLLIVLSGFAMGIQSAAIASLQLPGVSTTYITGLYTQLISKLVQRSPGSVAKAAHDTLEAKQHQRISLRLPIVVLITYGIGAIAGGCSLVVYPSFAPLVPLVGLITAALTACWIRLPELA